MSKFIELTLADGTKVCINTLEICYFVVTALNSPCKTKVRVKSKGDFQVKEGYEDIISLLQNVSRKIQ